MKPDQPEFNVEEWRALPYPERLRLMCVTWCTQGFGAPDAVYILYIMKIALYIAIFFVFTALTPSLGGPASFSSWWSSPLAFEKAILWTMMFEVMGFGCGSGPLTGHYGPMFPAMRHWLRPGTVRLRPFAWIPFTSGRRRTWFDVALYASVLTLLLRAMLASDLHRGELLPIILVLCVLGLRDKTIFLAARSEHYLLTAFVFLFPADIIPGAKSIQLLLWLGAATSKLNHHFPNVIAVMQSNSPIQRSKRVRRALYRNYPDDLRGSRLSAGIGHGATAVEYAFPLILAFTGAGPVHTVALVVMVLFHINILFSIPMGVPLEWNVMFIYSGLVLFGAHGDVHFWDIHSPLVAIAIIAVALIGPIYGNLRPEKISFLPAMRYYAGNWAASVWMFRPGTMERLDECITKAAPLHRIQLEGNIEPGTMDVTMSRGQAFRAMHLHGRALYTLLPEMYHDLLADDPRIAELGPDAFEMIDGEMVAGLVLGWNFGDGHLHDEQLLAAIQEQCDFQPGDLRCLFLESQPIHQQRMHWRVVDAATGPISGGDIAVRDLLELQPWGARAVNT
ncbi:MAG: DUF3556 domain-containing protein [Acidimicrobiia bacterium]